MRYALIITLGACYYFGWLPAQFVVPALLAFSLLRLPTGDGRTPRRGGYIHPPQSASAGESQTTAQRVQTYTGSSPSSGPAWARETAFTRLADLSRTSALGSSTFGSVGSPGRPGTAAEGITVTEGEHVFNVYPDRRGPADCGCGDTAA